MTSSPVSCTTILTHGSALLSRCKPRCSSGSIEGLTGEMATRTIGSAWKAMPAREGHMGDEHKVAVFNTLDPKPPMAQILPAGTSYT